MSPISNLAEVNRFILEHLSKNRAQTNARAGRAKLLREASVDPQSVTSSSTTRRKIE